ncbi:MAG: iron-containing alcohol dehydrogenase [Deltaproteobacteria bacterium]|nr:iron-containing alcohol dehydrogenase [Deltaproteobacteria bacterium]
MRSSTATSSPTTRVGASAVRFEFAAAGRIVFGDGVFAQAAPLARELGRRALVVADRALACAGGLLVALGDRGIETAAFFVEGEPTVETARRGAALCRDAACDLVVGLGGGSALDAAKAVAALVPNEGDVLDYLEVIGGGRPLVRRSLPTVAIPTTAGTGSEVTRNAVLKSPEHGVKVSLRSALMLPAVALIDPELSRTLPPAATAATGLDALAQLVEPYVSPRASPLTDALCREGLARAARSLRRAFEQGDDPAARRDMALGSLCGGLALANAGLGAVHGLAAPLGGLFPAPHGAVCGLLLPHVIDANVRALREREPGSPALVRYDEIARIVTGAPTASAADGAGFMAELVQLMRVPPLSSYGIAERDIAAVAAQAQQSSSMKGNPVALRDDELGRILRAAL